MGTTKPANPPEHPPSLHFLIIIKVDFLDGIVSNLDSIRSDKDTKIRPALEITYALNTKQKIYVLVHHPSTRKCKHSRSVVLAYRFVILNADPDTFTCTKLGLSNETYCSSFVEVLFSSLNLAPRTHRNIYARCRL